MVASSGVIKMCNSLTVSLSENTFISITLGQYKGKEEGLKNVYIKKILVKEGTKLSFTFRYKTKDIVKNYFYEDSTNLIGEMIENSFGFAQLFTTLADFVLESKGTKQIHKLLPPSKTELPSLEHNHQKNRLVTPQNNRYLNLLGITDSQGSVLKNSQDKYKQINHYLQILSPQLTSLNLNNKFQIVDMGSGKGYLTFALYDYLYNSIKLNVEIKGVEIRKDLVKLCNDISSKSEFANLSFIQGSIAEFEQKQIDILIALHACDTATDDAIYKGIKAGAQMIVVAPCCHKQIRREVERSKVKNQLDFISKYGIFLERECEMLTDGIRALIMEYFGYKIKIMEFVSDVHTPKNIMILGTKQPISEKEKTLLNLKIKEAKAFFGIENHYLEQLLSANFK